MNNETNSPWPSVVPNSGDDFNFLEFNDLDIDFSAAFGETPTGGDNVQQDDQAALKVQYGGPAFYGNDMPMRNDGSLAKASATDVNMLKGRISGLQVQPGSHPQTESRSYGAQQPLHYHAQGRIPPTPTSLDLHGTRSHFNVVDPHQQALFETHMRKQQDQMIFTPLGTPAVTPLDSQFQIPEYAVPGEYFSPLASPALHAQPSALEQAAYRHFPVSDQSETTSPVDMNFEPSLKTAPTSVPALKRQKRKSPSVAARPNARAVRESPAMKPQKAQRKKQSTSTVIPAREVADAMSAGSRPSTGGGSQRQGDSLALPASQLSSESGSISPEPISDLMPPPATPKPGSVGRSPYLASQGVSQSDSARPMKAPATPRSLMKIQEPQANGGDIAMQDISLGEAALEDRPFLPNLDTQMVDAQPTLAMPTRQTEISLPSSALSPTPVLPSPTASSAPTPKSAGAKSKNEFKAPAKSKKRNSSSHPSPALRPRISPSIKPLLPEGATINAETSALLLASKSNYQNILEGTHLPGVTYPEALSENLTSKRTSHKIAEQGRRNRINTALQEIASLLPHGGGNGGEAASDVPPAAPQQQSSSKANTVEMAIDYIKALQTELRDVKGKLAASQDRLKEVEQSVGKDEVGKSPSGSNDEAAA